MSSDTPSIRLQKYLSERGVTSRRGAADFIKAGLVSVNGECIREPGHRLVPGRDEVRVKGERVSARVPSTRTIVLNKPRGYICSRSGQQGKTVFDLLEGVEERLVSVGRLDKSSEGLLLLTNDGELANRLTHPRYGHAKTYRVTVTGDTAAPVIRRLNEPFVVGGYRTQPARVRVLRPAGKDDKRAVLEFVLTEGRNRQIREMCRETGLRVHRLARVAIGRFAPRDLSPGQWRDITAREAALLL